MAKQHTEQTVQQGADVSYFVYTATLRPAAARSSRPVRTAMTERGRTVALAKLKVSLQCYISTCL